MKRIISAMLTFALGLSMLCGCGGGKTSASDGESGEYFVASKLNKTDDGRVYVEVNGEPMLYTGAQVRIDGYVHLDNVPFDQMEEQLQKAAAMNVNTVQLPVCWSDLEPERDKYYFRQIGKLLGWANENGLKIEILWFTYQTGNIYCPKWIFDDEKTYPQYQCDQKGEEWGPEGKVGYLVYTTPALLERERLVIEALTDYIYEWEKANDFPVIVTGYQIHNEADNFPRWGISQKHVKLPDGSRYLTDIEAWNDVLTAYNNAGTAFKKSKWRAITRANLTTMTQCEDQWKSFAPRVFRLGGIDMVGDDTYTNSIDSQKRMMANLMGEEFGYNNFAHVAENAANYKNTASLILAALAQGAGYLMYCLQLPVYWVRDNIYDEKWEQGVFDTAGNEKEHTAEVRSILYGLKYAGTQFAVANTEDIAAFNVQTDFAQDRCEQQINTRSVSIRFKTESKAIGYAVYYKGYLTVYATQDSEIELSNADFSSVEYGVFKGYDFTSAGTARLENGNRLSMEGGKIYRIKVDNVKGELTSNTLDFIS